MKLESVVPVTVTLNVAAAARTRTRLTTETAPRRCWRVFHKITRLVRLEPLVNGLDRARGHRGLRVADLCWAGRYIAPKATPKTQRA
jgi:hypothetical protein